MTGVMVLTSTLSVFRAFPAACRLALLVVCAFHSSLDVRGAARTVVVSDVVAGAWFIGFCRGAVWPWGLRSLSRNFIADIGVSLGGARGQST